MVFLVRPRKKTLIFAFIQISPILHLQNTFIGAKWFIEGDIKGFFDNINHDVLIKAVQERIHDDRFIRLVRKFLNAGYMEEYIQDFDKGKRQLGNPEARVLEGRKMTVTKKLRKETDELKRSELQTEIRDIEIRKSGKRNPVPIWLIMTTSKF